MSVVVSSSIYFSRGKEQALNSILQILRQHCRYRKIKDLSIYTRSAADFVDFSVSSLIIFWFPKETKENKQLYHPIK